MKSLDSSAPVISQPEDTSKARQRQRPTFAIACWVLALIAFAQLMSIGFALSVKQAADAGQLVNRGPKVITSVTPIEPRSVEEIIQQYGHSRSMSSRGNASQHVPKNVDVSAFAGPPAMAVVPNDEPPNPPFAVIANPRVERLVQEARNMHIQGDMMRAMLKLDEATRLDASEPAVIYQKGLLFEDMGIFSKAADHYQKIQQMGLKSGSYYRLAAAKLTKGMDTRRARINVIALGPMKISRAEGALAGKQARVTIPLLARPDKPIDAEQLEVQVHFYDKLTNGTVEKAAAHSDFNRQWLGERIDWREAGNEETLIVDYTVAATDLVDDHLLGEREFYGCVVELIYRGEIIDQQASPRRLNSIHGNTFPSVMPDSLPGPWLPSDDEGLLPSQSGYGDNPIAPPLPSR